MSFTPRKIIAATNIAESSITIPGVVYVIDSLHVKTKVYDSRRSLESLVVQPVSKSAAHQRAGRAGRVRAGQCYRLCTKEDFDSLCCENSVPEIFRSNLVGLIIQLKSLGVSDITRLDLP